MDLRPKSLSLMEVVHFVVRYLRSQVLAILLYGCEPGNHMEGDLKIVFRFLRRCMVKLAGTVSQEGCAGLC